MLDGHVSSILVGHVPEQPKHMLFAEFAYLQIAGAAERYGASMTKHFPKCLRALDRSSRTLAFDGLPSGDSAINEIEG